YCNYQQDDWVEWLPSAEFNANNAESETTKVTPFFANTAQHPRTAISPLRKSRPPDASQYLRVQQNLATEFVNQMEELNNFLRENMKTAQAFYEKHSNRHRSPPTAYKVGDRVFINARNIKTKRPSKKLDWKNLGPFLITEIVSSHAYRLKLPEDLKSIHPVFHTSLLRPDPNNPFPGQTNEANPPIEVDSMGEDLYELDAILGSRRTDRGFEYLVKYTGDVDISWQPLPNIVSGESSELVSDFHRKHPRSVKPNARELRHAREVSRSSISEHN
ncbi:hypothetical protein K3495_g16164, partial [Podosphaera aphanis]